MTICVDVVCGRVNSDAEREATSHERRNAWPCPRCACECSRELYAIVGEVVDVGGGVKWIAIGVKTICSHGTCDDDHDCRGFLYLDLLLDGGSVAYAIYARAEQ